MNKPPHLVVEKPKGIYNDAGLLMISMVSPYLADLANFIKSEYFAMADNFDVAEVLMRFTDTMGEREELIARALAEVDLGELVFLQPDDPNYEKVRKILGSTDGNVTDTIAYPKSVNLEEWIAANGSPAEDE